MVLSKQTLWRGSLLIGIWFLITNPLSAAPVIERLHPIEGISFVSVLRGIVGVATLLVIALCLSKNRRAIQWRMVWVSLLTQLLLAFAILYVPFVQSFFTVLGQIFLKIMDFTKEGMRFLVGDLVDVRKSGYIFLFQALPTILFFSALTSLLYYLHIIQVIVNLLGWALRKLFGITGAEGITVGGNIFLGMAEAPLLAKRYLPVMTYSELFLVMSAGMATIAGGVMVAYIGMLGGEDPQSRLLFARYLLAASVMAAPAVIAISKIIYPQTESVGRDCEVSELEKPQNLMEAITSGTVQGLRLVANVAAMLLVFISLVAMANYLLGGLLGRYTGLNDWLASLTEGRYTEFNFQFLLGLLFTPLVWLLGVCSADMHAVGVLLGEKLVMNEFVAYADLAQMKAAGLFLEEKSIVMATYLLCGFANIGSVGIIIGAFTTLVPEKRAWITRHAMLCMVCGALASAFTATLMGAILG